MVEVNLTRDIAASSDAVWAVLENFGDLSWVPGAGDNVEVIGEGVGMIRRINMEGLDPIDEVLESMDRAAKSLSYSIAKNAVIPFDKYVASVRVAEKDASTATVFWDCTFDEGEIPGADAKAMIEGNYNMLLDGLTGRVTGG